MTDGSGTIAAFELVYGSGSPIMFNLYNCVYGVGGVAGASGTMTDGTGVSGGLITSIGGGGGGAAWGGITGTISSQTDLWAYLSTLFTDPMTTDGDLITQASGVPARLGIGTTNQVLCVVGGLPAWVDSSTLAIGEAVGSGTPSDVLYVDAGGLLAQDSGLTYNPSGTTLKIDGGGANNAILNISASSSNVAEVTIGNGTYNASLYVTPSGASLALQSNNIDATAAGMRVGIASTELISFWGATPIVQPQTVGTIGTFTPGSGTPMNSDSTSDGAFGTTGYTFGDIVLALKSAGLIKA
jgi:hypothetical protein